MTVPRFITVLFGSLGDTLMALALFDDVVRKMPDAKLVILARRNVGMIRELARAYPGIEVRQVPGGLGAVPFFMRIFATRGWIFLTLALASGPYSREQRLFFKTLGLIPGNRTIGFYDEALHELVTYEISLSILDNFRKMLPRAFPEVWPVAPSGPPHVVLDTVSPQHFPYAPGTYVVVHMFGASIASALPARRWRALCAHLEAQYPELTVILTGIESQRGAAQEVAQGFKNVAVRTDLSLLELGWIIDHAALYVGIDTGVTHLASILQQKSIVIRHCSDPSWVPSYNPHARILLNSAHCTPQDPGHCVMSEENGVQYRQCTIDISDALIVESVDLALSSRERAVASFAGIVDEGRRKDEREDHEEHV